MGLFLSSAVIESNQIWLLAPKQSLLCVLNKKTKELKVVAYLADENVKNRKDECGLYYGIIKVDDSIYVFPDRAEHIAVYHIPTEKLKYINIDWKSENWRESNGKIGTAYSVDNYLYFIGKQTPVILKMNRSNLEQKLIHVQVENEMWRKAVQIENKIYIPSLFSRKIVIFDVSTDVYKIEEIPIGAKGIACVERKENQLLVVPVDSAEMYELDVEEWKVVKKYDLSTIKELKYNKNEIPFMHLFIEKTNYWFFPWNANLIAKMDIITGQAESVYIFDDERKNRYINAFRWDDKHIFGYYTYGDSLDFCDIQTGKVERYPNAVPANMQFYWENKIKNGYREIIDENDMGLSSFIKLLQMETI